VGSIENGAHGKDTLGLILSRHVAKGKSGEDQKAQNVAARRYRVESDPFAKVVGGQ